MPNTFPEYDKGYSYDCFMDHKWNLEGIVGSLKFRTKNTYTTEQVQEMIVQHTKEEMERLKNGQ